MEITKMRTWMHLDEGCRGSDIPPARVSMTDVLQGYQANEVYFFILFVDPDLTIPVIRTIRFVGTVPKEGGSRTLLFQGVDDAAEKIALAESEVTQVVLTGDELIERLRRCFEGKLALVRD